MEIPLKVGLPFVSVGGAYITYVQPRRLCIAVGHTSFRIEQRALILLDAMVHHLPLLLLLWSGNQWSPRFAQYIPELLPRQNGNHCASKPTDLRVCAPV